LGDLQFSSNNRPCFFRPSIRQLPQLVSVQPELLQRGQRLGDLRRDLSEAISGQAEVAQMA
jgi:hypothetical protein